MKHRKYIFISGGVISGIGKGITSASLSLLLKSCGYRIAPIKFENYLNVDAGTINPIEHGDVFLCDDGTEADMDIGTYEKYLDQDMGVENFVTIGKIYKTVIDRERRFEYKGEDVEAMPHIVDEILARITAVQKKNDADIVVVELGGTVGEYQNALYYEAARQLTLRKPGDVIHIHVSYIPTPSHLGEPKTKPTQLSVRTLNGMGIQPDYIVGRSERPLDERRKERLALFCNIHADSVINNPDVDHVYQIPEILAAQDLHNKILRKFKLIDETTSLTPQLTDWRALTSQIIQLKKNSKEYEVAIIGKYFGSGEYHLHDAYAALFDAIDHASWAAGVKVKTRWISATDIEKKGVDSIGRPDGIIVPIGWGERGAEGMIAASGYAREKNIPYLGLCYGMQLAVVSYARDILGWRDANTTENDAATTHPVIHIIDSQRELMERRAYGGTMRLGKWEALLKTDSLVESIYMKYADKVLHQLSSHISTEYDSRYTVFERHRHRYEFNDAYLAEIEAAGLIISARSRVEGLVECVELPQLQHPFYIATQGHPEYKSRPLAPHPLFIAFIRACKDQVE